MNEEKSMIEYKESRGLFHWLKSRFEKIKEKFRPKEEVQETKEQEEGELFEEQLDEVLAGRDPNLIDFEEEKAKIDKLDHKPWELTEEQKQVVEEGYEQLRKRAERSEDELHEDDLDKITAGHPIIEDDEYSR